MNTHPNSTEFEAVRIEQLVLGGILTDPAFAYPIAASILRHDDFYLDGNALVFRTCADLWRQGINPDAMSVVQALQSAGNLKYPTDLGYITTVSTSVISALDIESHARIVLDASRRRTAVKSAYRVVQDSLDGNRPLDQTLQTWGRDLDSIAARGVTDDSMTTLKRLADEEADRLAALYNAGHHENNHVTTGFGWLDDALGGYQAGDLIIWAARPNTGKTRVVLYSLAACANAGYPVAFISLDMARRRLLQYLIPTAVNVRGGHLYGAELYNPNMWGAVEEARLRDMCAQADPDGNFWLVAEPSSSSMGMIEGYCYKLAKKGCRVVAIDQAQNIAGWEGGASNRGEYTRIFKGLKEIARSYRMAVVLLHQIQRAGAGAPTLASLKDTGNAEEYSDAVLILHDTQRALIDAYGGFVTSGVGNFKRPAKEPEASIRRQVDTVRPLRMGLDKNRNAETTRKYVNFDFARGIKA